MFIDKKIDENGDVYLKYFLIDTSLNDRGWAASPEWVDAIAQTAKELKVPVTVVRDIKDSIRPGVPTGDYHAFHPNPQAPPLDDIEHAKKFQWAQVIDIVPTNPQRLAANSSMPNHMGQNIIPSGIYKGYDAILKVTDSDVAKAIREGRTDVIPPEVSPGIVWYSGPKHSVEQAAILHLASVPKGAYGPRAKQIAQCIGGDSCQKKLLAASSSAVGVPIFEKEPKNWFESITDIVQEHHDDKIDEIPKLDVDLNQPKYHDRTGGCPLVALSSLVSDSGISTNSMSFSSQNSSRSPTPHTYGTMKSYGASGNLLGTQQSSNKGFQVTSQTPQKSKLKVTIKSPKRLTNSQANDDEEKKKLAEAQLAATPQTNTEVAKPNPVQADHHKSPEELEKEKQEQEGQQEQQPQAQAQPQPDQALPQDGNITPDKAVKELDNMRREIAAERRRWTVATLIPREEFSNKNGKVQEKEWLKAIDEAIAKGWTDDHIIEYYELRRQARAAQQVPLLSQQVSRPVAGKLGASSLSAEKANSSQDAPYDYETTVKCIKLMKGRVF